MERSGAQSLRNAEQCEAGDDDRDAEILPPAQLLLQEDTTEQNGKNTICGGQKGNEERLAVKGEDIYMFTPIQYPADKVDQGTITTHFDFHAMDDRLVKLDILGHDDPTALRMLQDLTGIDPTTIPLDDPDTRKIYSSPASGVL